MKKNKAEKRVRERKERPKDFFSDELLFNRDFEEYYKQQNILNDNDFVNFLESLKKPLPISFRITGNRKHAADLLAYMKENIFSAIAGASIDGVAIPCPVSLPWYPNDMGWSLDVGKTVMRRSPEVKKMQNFLVAETEIGNISRQEAVSMLSPLFLDVKPGHKVLDLCAAPGSKTAQLLEAVMNNDGEFPSGLVIANDSDQKRAYMLVHQAKRLQSPCLLVTNHDAQEFPRIVVASESGSGLSCMQFDRILCDVPCSGDGTLRKNKTIFKTWVNTQGNGLHAIQLNIFKRGCVLLKQDGLIVYSTCSFNPVENEAVVCAMLNEAKGSLELLDVCLPGLEKMPGLFKWKVKKNGKYYETFEKGEGLQETMFPPDNISSHPMERCIRVYPFMQNTGGFFIAVFKKVGPYGSIDEGKAPKVKKQKRALSEVPLPDPKKVFVADGKQEMINVNESEKKTKKAGWGGLNEEPFLFLEENNHSLNDCCDKYGLSDSVPRDTFLVRCEETNSNYRHIYLVTREAKSVLTSKNAESIKVVNTGVKIFTRLGGVKQNGFRICNEAIQTVGPHLSLANLVSISIHDLIVLTSSEYPLFTELSVEGQETMRLLEYGSYILISDPQGETNYRGSIQTPVYAPFLRSHTSCNLLLDKAERKSLLCRLNGKDLDIQYGSLHREEKVVDV